LKCGTESGLAQGAAVVGDGGGTGRGAGLGIGTR
jgi:hypothetical protein